MKLEFPVFDADNHLYETEEALTRHLPAEHEGLFKYITIDGRTKLAVRNRISDYIPNPTFEVVAKPGAYMEYYSGKNTEGKSLRELAGKPIRAIAAFRNPDARLKLLDELGIQSALMFPTLASLIEVNFLDSPTMTATLLHAFNQWLLDDWTFNYRDRIYPTPVLNPTLVDAGIAELEFVLEHGARIVLVRPGPVASLPHTKSPFLPEFDPFWARVEEAGIPVALHASDSGYQRYVNDWEGRDAEFAAFKPSPFANASVTGRAITDTFLSAVCHGMLTRFPNVKLLSIENGGSWVGGVLAALDNVYEKMPQEFSEHPRDTFLRCVYVNPFWEDSVDNLIDVMGADHVLFGSDYPHPEGLAQPLEWVNELGNRSPDDIRQIMGANMYRLLGVKTPAK